jgi:hypothetical protein
MAYGSELASKAQERVRAMAKAGTPLARERNRIILRYDRMARAAPPFQIKGIR